MDERRERVDRVGNNHRFLGELDEAIEALKHPVELMPYSGHAHSNLAIGYIQAGRFEESLALFEAAIQLVPDDDILFANRGYGRLTAGIVADGWSDWEHGACLGGPRGAERELGVTRWQPDEYDVRVTATASRASATRSSSRSCYPDLIAHARDVVIECDSRLVGLFARSFPGVEARAQTFSPYLGETATDFDRSIPAGSLPVHFRSTVDAFPNATRTSSPIRCASRPGASACTSSATARSWACRGAAASTRRNVARSTPGWTSGLRFSRSPVFSGSTSSTTIASRTCARRNGASV